MKKTLLLFILILVPLLAAQAQFFRFGAKAGGGFARAAGDDADADYINSLAVLHAGLLLTLQYSPKIAVQAEPQYSQKGVVYDNDPISPTEAMNGDLRFDYLEVPLLFKYQKAALFVEAGPYLGYLVNVNSDVNLVNPDDPNPDDPVILGEQKFSRSDFQDLDYGYAIGGGIILDNGFFLGLRHTGGLRTFPKADLSQRNLNFLLSIGFLNPVRSPSNY
ncbi:porin family protein [Pontibacter ruber]|uniref:Porin family protein n=1 Tax=Pontibacter ruber TaxID=1343895 RepID=A0ABW5D1V0_9BACT|nr:porin family protein [Pontibacter ruber]